MRQPVHNDRFTVEFATQAWAQVGRLPIDDFDELLETLEHFSRESAARLRAGAQPEAHAGVPLASGRLIAECTFNDVARRITVLSVEFIEQLAG